MLAEDSRRDVRLETAATADGTEISRDEATAIAEKLRLYDAAAAASARATQAASDHAAAERDASVAAKELHDSLDGLSRDVGDALGGLITGTRDWRDALGEVLGTALRIAETQFERSGAFQSLFAGAGSAISEGVGGFLGSVFGGLFADGAAFRAGQVVPFAHGAVVGSPTFFPMAGGRIGLMGERPPGEAIMPLVKTASGSLGVRAEGGGGGLTFNSFVDARGSTMTPGEFRAIARDEARQAVRVYDRNAAAPSIRNSAWRQRA